MINNVNFEDGTLGVRAVVSGIWQEYYLDLFLEKKVLELELNDGKGWLGKDLSFIKFLGFLKSLTIIDFKIKCLSPIHYLEDLLVLNLSTYSKSPINFRVFPNLLDCGFEWITGSDTLFENSSIQKLFLNSYNRKSSDVFLNMRQLSELSILNSSIDSIRGLKNLSNLKYLRLGNCNELESVEGLENLQSLERLIIQRCKKVNTIYEVFELSKLEEFFILDMGKINSVVGIEKLKNLGKFAFYESTEIIDGNLAPILQLKNLNDISFKNRKHYSHRLEDFNRT